MKTTARYVSYLLSTVALSFTGAIAAPGDAAVQLAATTKTLHDGSFVGQTYDAYYGTVQVQATIAGGSITDVKALKFPNHSGTSRSINRQALPYLLQEVVAKQSAKVNIISGATLTSRAYISSLRDALNQSAQ